MNTEELRPASEATGAWTDDQPRKLSISNWWDHHRISSGPVGTLLGALAVTLLLAAFVIPPLRAATKNVDIVDFAFRPKTVTITVGNTVSWTNLDGVPHSATEAAGSPPAFDTGVYDTGSRSVQFNTAGTFEYFCVIHPGMEGLVVVEDPDVMEAVYLPLVLR